MRASDAWEGTLALFFVRAHGWIPRKKSEEERACASRRCRAACHTKKKSRAQSGAGMCDWVCRYVFCILIS